MHGAHTCTLTQGQHIPVDASGDLRQQLHNWARRAAAVRAGGLHVAREFSNFPHHSAVTPKLTAVAAHSAWGKYIAAVAPLPAEGRKVDVQQILQASGQQLLRPVREGHVEEYTQIRYELDILIAEGQIVICCCLLPAPRHAGESVHACFCSWQ